MRYVPAGASPGKLIRSARREAGVTRADLAAACGLKSQTAVYNWETRGDIPPLKYAAIVAKKLEPHLTEADLEEAIALAHVERALEALREAEADLVAIREQRRQSR